VLSHFALSEGFALIVLIVPDRDGAQLCRDELERLLTDQGNVLAPQEPATPEELVELSKTLLDLPSGSEIGAVWIAAVVPHSATDFITWEAAWRRALEGFNQQRNPLRRHFVCPLIIVAAPWIVPLFREAAPDLWSVRSQVVWIEPDREPTRPHRGGTERGSARSERPTPVEAPDPALALQEAERLRGRPGRERERAAMLTRAGVGLLGRGTPRGAEEVLREAADLLAASEDVIARGVTVHELGRAILDQGRAAEAEATFRRALALAEEGGATAVSRSITVENLGRAIRNQGRVAEAEETFRNALALAEEGAAAEDVLGSIQEDLRNAKFPGPRSRSADDSTSSTCRMG
jgi:tetratricopeptide (TPR) repeat protein